MTEPLVSIGMPVYNGEQFIRQAIDSILAQTFENFELIISDNASTDKTEEICREYAEKDKRIRYYRNEKNIGAALNYDRTFHVSRGKYFKWAAHDDVLAPAFLARTVEVLENSPSVIACCTHTILIDDEGRITNHSNANATNPDRVRQLDSDKPHERYREILSVRMCFEVFSLVRADKLKKTSLSGTYYGADKVFLTELSILGPIVEIPEPLFFNRRHSNQSASIKTVKEREKWIGSIRKNRFVSPRLLCIKGYLHAIFKYELNPLEQFACLIVFSQWFVDLSNWQRMTSNVIGDMRQHLKALAQSSLSDKLSLRKPEEVSG